MIQVTIGGFGDGAVLLLKQTHRMHILPEAFISVISSFYQKKPI
ncbi:hypothetical protein [Mariniflexile rhizosphaerae]|nr:hypothetical protein [Mariniflexile sp. TRM1-10]